MLGKSWQADRRKLFDCLTYFDMFALVGHFPPGEMFALAEPVQIANLRS